MRAVPLPAIKMSQQESSSRPIGIFDSGVGGLTVLKSIRETCPDEKLLYLGDTARLPYGTKSAKSVARYALQAAAHLQKRDIKLLVIACNTASAVALVDLQKELAPLPVIGVVQPGALAAVSARPAGRHLVLATEATVALGAYSRAIKALDAKASVSELACELLVALAEEGWTAGSVAESIVHKYLDGALDGSRHSRINSLILGCTHFPLLRPAIRLVVGNDISIVDSASTTATVVDAWLEQNGMRNRSGNHALSLLATDGARRFARVGGTFLGTSLTEDDVEIVDL